MRRLPLLGLVLLISVVAACRPEANTARGVAERFIDAHYVVINLPAARDYCAGLARSRIEEEIRLTAGQSIGAMTRQPRVYYRLLEETPRGKNRVSFLYEATFDVDGAGQFKKKLLLTLRHDPAGWRVTNYGEFD